MRSWARIVDKNSSDLFRNDMIDLTLLSGPVNIVQTAQVISVSKHIDNNFDVVYLSFGNWSWDAEKVFKELNIKSLTAIHFDKKVNIEANHATLSGHSFAHELQMCTDAGMLGSIDANRGNAQNGWDTDQFPTDLSDAVQAMMVLLADGGFKSGGLNFDAKVRRESTTVDDLVMAHIGGMDTFARALVIAHNILENSPIPANKINRYSSYDKGKGAAFEQGDLTLTDLRNHAAEIGEPDQISGQQEWLENVINDYMFRG